MSDVTIENPILNSPYEEPRRHFRFEADGIRNDVVETRRVSFDPPETGKVAVKVINHYGDEVLKVYEVGK